LETVTRILASDDERILDYLNIKDAQLQRRGALFLVEGHFVLRRFLSQSRFAVHSVLVHEKQLERLRDLLSERAIDFPIYVADAKVLNDIVGYKFHRGVIALGHRKSLLSLEDIVENASRIVLLEGLSNPDNVGSTFRNAAGLGADAIVIDHACADPLYRMSTRVSIGTSLTLPWTRIDDWVGGLKKLKERGFVLAGLTPSAHSYDIRSLKDIPEKWALVLGSEGYGLSPKTLKACDLHLRIEMQAEIDSLNVATAAAIGLFALQARK
jgi:tRNA G18 (ribose-2'-O)-methylase SpoU